MIRFMTSFTFTSKTTGNDVRVTFSSGMTGVETKIEEYSKEHEKFRYISGVTYETRKALVEWAKRQLANVNRTVNSPVIPESEEPEIVFTESEGGKTQVAESVEVEETL